MRDWFMCTHVECRLFATVNWAMNGHSANVILTPRTLSVRGIGEKRGPPVAELGCSLHAHQP